MSRSYRKNPICKDNGSSKSSKRCANRKTRRHENELPSKGCYYKKIYEQYDIHDWVSRWTWEEALADFHSNGWRWHPEITNEKELYRYWYKAMKMK